MRDLTRLDGVHYAVMSVTDEQDDNLELPAFEDGNGGVYLCVPKIIVGIDNPIKTRSYEEIVNALTKYFNFTWYDRHMNGRLLIERGIRQIVDSRTPSDSEFNREDWDVHLNYAKDFEADYGLENYELLRPYEMGMLHGKLSALRWVMGAEMDTLQT